MVCPIRFGSWMGGDRDGNPNVTAHVTDLVAAFQRWFAADLYLRDLDKLREQVGSPAWKRGLVHVLHTRASGCSF